MKQVVNIFQTKLGYVQPTLKFGVRGGGKCEECEGVTVWVRLMGYASNEHWRFTLDPKTQLHQLRGYLEDAVGHEVDQQCFVDECGYRFSQSDLQRPISSFSNNCKLHVDFTYDPVASTRKYVRSKL